MSDDGMYQDATMTPEKMRRGMLTNADEHVFWSGTEIERMIDCWEQNAEAVNSSRNEKAMADIAAYIDTNKSAKQVRAKLKKMRCRYIQEKEKMIDGKTTTKWRFFNRLHKFGHKIIKNPSRKPRERHSPETNEFRNPRLQLQNLRDAAGNSIGPQILTVSNNMTELPPIYPYDPDVPADVAVDPVWTNWNATLPYAMTDSGLRTLMRSGFRDISHLELLKRKTANVSMLNLNYHDKLALEYALESDNNRAQQYQVITETDGTVIEVRGCHTECEETLLLSAEGQKLAAWSKSLPHPLGDHTLIKVMKAGFLTPEDIISLLSDDEIDDLDLCVRDKAALRKAVRSGNVVTTVAMTE